MIVLVFVDVGRSAERHLTKRYPTNMRLFIDIFSIVAKPVRRCRAMKLQHELKWPNPYALPQHKTLANLLRVGDQLDYGLSRLLREHGPSSTESEHFV